MLDRSRTSSTSERAARDADWFIELARGTYGLACSLIGNDSFTDSVEDEIGADAMIDRTILWLGRRKCVDGID
jgi:hypothetical protein